MENAFDVFAICVKKDAEVVSHIPRKISSICSMLVLWLNIRGSDAYHEIHKILCTTKFNMRTVVLIH